MSTANPHASPRRSATLFALLGLAVLSVAGLSACIGTTPLSIETVIKALTGSPSIDPVLQQIVIDFRLPRILTSILAGAALATAGLMMQTIFRNPLADPFVLGVNSGASLGVAIVLLALAPSRAQPDSRPWCIGADFTDPCIQWRRSDHALHRISAVPKSRHHVGADHRPNDQLYSRRPREYSDVFQHGRALTVVP